MNGHQIYTGRLQYPTQEQIKDSEIQIGIKLIENLLQTYFLFLGCIGFLVKLVEQKVEHDGVHSNPPDESFWVVAINEEKLECVNHNGNELNLMNKKIHFH